MQNEPNWKAVVPIQIISLPFIYELLRLAVRDNRWPASLRYDNAVLAWRMGISSGPDDMYKLEALNSFLLQIGTKAHEPPASSCGPSRS